MSRRAIPLRVLYVAVAVIAAGCVTEATGIVVHVDTDVPPDIALTVRIAVRSGDVQVFDARRDATWSRLALDSGAYDGGAAFPASFGIAPSNASARSGAFTLLVEGVTGRYTLRRIAHLAFVPGRMLTLPIFLSARCMAPSTDCTATTGSCSVQQACEDHGQTCGSSGTCVALAVQPIDPHAPGTSQLDGSIDAPIDPTTESCGVGRPCCTAGDACEPGEICTSTNICAQCGQGLSCCSSGTVCPDGFVCSNETCLPCGAAGQPCCESDTCSQGACVAGVCQVACGSGSQPCCENNGCTAGSTCSGGSCVCASYCIGRCGGASDGCGGRCTAACPSGYLCIAQHCRRCGVLGSPCCPGADCSGASHSAYCCNSSTTGRPTCPNGAADGRCHRCGAEGQSCCPRQTCNYGGQMNCGGSSEANDLICRSENCGVAGGFCCTWRAPPCDNGMMCDYATGHCI